MNEPSAISPDPCCAHCYNIPVGPEVGDSLLTITTSGPNCECLALASMPLTSFAAGARRWYWSASPMGGVPEPYPGGWLLHFDGWSYYYAGPVVAVSCITSGENRGQWLLHIEYYLPKDHPTTPFTGPFLVEAVLPCDALEINEHGCLVSPEPVSLGPSEETGGCTITLNWTGC